MRFNTKIGIRLAAISALLLLCGCNSDEQKPAADANQQTVANDFTADQELYRKAANEIAILFSRDLKDELKKALNAGGPADALGVCKDKAPEITDMYAHSGWKLKRVSDKFRNQSNRADSTELAFMDQFRDTTQSAPEFLVDWSEPDSVDHRTFHYYKPIRINKLCLKCHGDMQTLGQGVYASLRKHYPLDRATGYKSGDLRGMIVIEADWPNGRDHAEQILASGSATQPIVDTPVQDTLTDTTM